MDTVNIKTTHGIKLLKKNKEIIIYSFSESVTSIVPKHLKENIFKQHDLSGIWVMHSGDMHKYLHHCYGKNQILMVTLRTLNKLKH